MDYGIESEMNIIVNDYLVNGKKCYTKMTIVDQT